MATPQITRAGPVPRQEGLIVPRLLTPPRWTDAFNIVANTAETYTLPVDAAGNRATILRILSTAALLFIKWDGVATVPVGDVTNGTSSFVGAFGNRRRLIAAPNSAYALSFITTTATGIVTIEAWS